MGFLLLVWVYVVLWVFVVWSVLICKNCILLSVCFMYCCLAVVMVLLCAWDCDSFILFCLCRFYSFAHRGGFWGCVGVQLGDGLGCGFFFML